LGWGGFAERGSQPARHEDECSTGRQDACCDDLDPAHSLDYNLIVSN
jgi:hypothetical protein